ncbi:MULTISPECIES: hypothetical protein [Nocardia]|uniref:WXG100 family type VII secretion target n=1 Tax=Nocardia implantans TaxID=3108168 RepID=A0ABU6B274_9NOCA|nr:MULTISPECIES: hypothetical protein [unclassified Nocardia]MBF6194998.1 hypothetical protein [Nocardia beijingensis]MEA3530341.1 hypothetical protein [Nocardia sp. CDC192]MEB3513799.1 hypothetical protein [Nocardia sp. CDC186]
MRVNWQTYFDAGKQCHDLAAELRRTDKPLHDAVKGDCAGMAGDAPGCKQWGEAYDRYARDTMQTCTHLSDALTNFGNVLYANGYKYAIADNAKPQRPTLHQVSEYQVTIPTSVRDNGDGVKHNGGVEEFFNELTAKIVSTFGKLPNGDVDKLSKAADTWKTFANHATITGAAAKISGIAALFDDMDAAENRAKIQEHFGTLKSSAELLATASLNVAAPVADYHSSTVEVGEGIKTAMTTFSWAVGLLVTGAIVGAIFSFGGSLAVAGGGVALAVEDTIATIRGLYTTKRLFQILKITLAASVAVGVVDAFGQVPDVTATLTKLAAIIAMKVLIDDNSPTATPALGGDDPITQEIAKKIADHANGRAAQGDGSHYVSGVGAAELPEYVRKVLDGEVPTEVKHLPRGRTAYWDPEKGAVVIEDGDGGTVFTPKDGREYFDGL